MNTIAKLLVLLSFFIVGYGGITMILMPIVEERVEALDSEEGTSELSDPENKLISSEDHNDEDYNTDDENDDEPQELEADAQKTLDYMREYWARGKSEPQRIKVEYPSFITPTRKDELDYYPCMDCHEDEEEEDLNNPTERQLVDEHEDVVLTHGGERFWCHTCHNITNTDYFRSMKNTRIDFNESHLLCGQCHFQRQKDWFFGGHGKRLGNWNGERVVLLCVECHDPHSPDIKPRPPDPPPKRHIGPSPLVYWLQLRAKRDAPTIKNIWEKIEAK